MPDDAPKDLPSLDVAPIRARPILRDEVAQQLEDLIVSRALLPGQRLLETEIAAKFGVSRNPVREALAILALRGWVDLRPHHGAVVHEPTAKEVADFFHLRRILEGEAARLAATRITHADLEELRTILRQGAVALDEGDSLALADLNSEFHAVITRVADNTMLSRVLGILKKRLTWYFQPVANVRGRDSWDEHARILEALEAGDAERAAAAVQDHTAATASRYLSEHGAEHGAEHRGGGADDRPGSSAPSGVAPTEG